MGNSADALLLSSDISLKYRKDVLIISLFIPARNKMSVAAVF